MSNIKASTARQAQTVADHLHYAAADQIKALEQLISQANDGDAQDQAPYWMHLSSFATDTAVHHWHHGKYIMDEDEINPQQIDEWIATGWAIIESRLDAVDVLTTMTNDSITITETADGYETTLTSAAGDEAAKEHITTSVDPRAVPALLAHLLNDCHRWADQLITGRTMGSL